ncbi:hypothetical protein INS49_003042 [Diaporthe citri]|uniref:uncharacterized protein n=1 Tax=Diaporthe citri TaxID=83186 RepID=UPI001C7E893B|nr:uncharacterized protein INS49_003042 [Diaporthe citri]KAG6368826.1 hypothetical protein INS49_003042 [Diaporthe citri]
MKVSIVQATAARSPLSASKTTGTPQSGTASQLPLTREPFNGDARLDNPDDASIGIDTCGWFEGTAVTCPSPAACGFSRTFRACCVGHACSSSVFNTACLPYDDLDARSTDTSSPACLTLFWPTTPGAPDLTVFTMVDSCVPISQAGQGIMVTTSPPQTPAQSSPQHSSASPLLKPPAGTILEAFLGVTAVSVVVIISCIIITRKLHAARTGALRAGASRSSLTVSALAEQEGRQPDIPLSMRPGTVRAGSGGKMDRSHGGNRQCGLETAREQEV